MMPSAVRSLGCLFLLLAAAACERDGDGGAASLAWRGTIDTLPNGAVAVRNPAEPAWDSAAAWRAVEELRIGAADGDGPDVFSDVRDVAVDRAGRIYVLQNTAKRVTVFDSAGRFVRSFGREGSGPGEFADPNGLQLDPAGRVWVSDPRNTRYVVYDTAGTLVASHQRRLSMWGWRWDGRFTSDGRLVELDAIRGAPGERSGRGFVRFDSTLATVDTVLRTPPPPGDPNEDAFVFRRANMTMFMSIPFRPGTASVIDRRGFHWSGESGEYRLVQRRFDGDTVRVVTREYTPVPVTDEEIAEFRERMGENAKADGYDESRIPRTKPAFQGMTVASDGHLWLRRHLPFGEDATVFDVFDPEGRYLGEVRLDAEIDASGPLLIDGETIHAVARDEMDIPQVVRWRIVRP